MIECKDLIKIYEDPVSNTRTVALRGIDLKIKKSEIISIIGPSGSGKTTLINVLAGIEPISSGKLHVGEYELENMNYHQLLEYRMKMIGIIHQFPERALIFNCTVLDNLLFSASFGTKDKKAQKETVNEILTNLNLKHLQKQRIHNLSGGEMTRTAVATMLAKNAPLLLCDEPTGQLDSENAEKVKELLRQVSRDYGTTVVVVSHDQRFLKGIDKTCEIVSGRVGMLVNAQDQTNLENLEFPMRWKSSIDSSQSVRIPNKIFDVLKLADGLEFILHEDSKVEIKHPEGVTPKQAKLQEKIKTKKLDVQVIPNDYYIDKQPIIAITDTSKTYFTNALKIEAIKKVNLTIYKEDLLFIVGPSGSGKTTLLKLITGIESCTKGSIIIANKKIHQFSDRQRAIFRRNNIGIVAQQGNLHPFLTVRENLFVKDILSNKVVKLRKLPNNEINEAFSRLNIEHRKDYYPLEISGGEFQRASLAIAQYKNPALIVLDEPTANLDAELAKIAMEEIFSFHKQNQLTTLITTHDLNMVKEGARVIVLQDGEIVKNGLAHLYEE